jgi:hypothetical protein
MKASNSCAVRIRHSGVFPETDVCSCLLAHFRGRGGRILIQHTSQEDVMDFLPLVILSLVGYTVFVMLFIRFIGMLRHKDNVALK